MTEEARCPGFCTYRNKGFHMTFENGYTVSVQFGAGNYCEQRNNYDDDESHHSSRDAEIAAWDRHGNWFRSKLHPEWFEYDDVSGWKTPEEVVAFIAEVSTLS